MTGGSSGTDRADVREHVRPGVTRAEEVVANASGENFPVALRVLPAVHRRHLTALYGFARLTDDLGDEARETGQADGDLRLGLLDELDADVDRIYQGATPRAPVMQKMAVTVAECHVPARPLRDLIQANRQDQRVTRYQTYAELARYCELSANPVGQIVLHIFGAATPERIALSDNICTALQLAEHWQDVAEDLANGRIYLPAEDLDLFNVTEADLAVPSAGPAVRDLMRFETDRAARLLDQGAPLVGTLRGAARVAVAGYLAGGRAALAAIRGQRYDVLIATARPRKPRMLVELAKAYARGR
ncbi:MAG TPA: squalene synthase HpnC [Streptosporangiaceae bacterium]|nr:squalene synthase HpnC [Streptosporangiaceae bacterium]